MPSKKILCIGDVILDIIPTPFPISKEKILLDGETFVDSVTFQKGGCAGNFSCILKSIFPDANVSLVSRVGEKPYSDFLISEIEKFHVLPLFKIDPSTQTQVTIAVSYKDGQRHYLTFLGGLNNFSIQDIPKDAFSDVDHLAFRGIWFAEKLLLDSEGFLKEAMKKGIEVSMDLGFDPYWNLFKEDPQITQKLEKRRLAAYKILKYVKFLFGNEQEFMLLTNTSTIEEAIYEIVSKGIKNIIIHRGKKGCRIIKPYSSDPNQAVKSIDIPALSVEVVNPVGSGDTFDSILLAQVMEGKSLIQAAAMATAGAAYSLMNPAGTKITLEIISSFIQNYSELVKYLD